MNKLRAQRNSLRKKLYECQKNYDELEQRFEDYKKRSVSWCVEDIIYQAQEMGYRISLENAEEALYRMIEKHDAKMGISWTTVTHFVMEYGEKI